MNVVLTLFLVIFSGFSTIEPYIDVPFEDPFVAHRFLLPKESIADWDHLPSNDVPVSLQSFNNGKSVIYQTGSSLWLGEVGKEYKWKRVDIEIGVTMSSSFSFTIRNGGEMLLAGNDSIFEVTCSTSKCSQVSKMSISLGKVNEVVLDTSSSPQTSYFIGSTLGLFYYSSSSKVSTLLSDETTAISIHQSQIAIGTNTKLYLFESNDMLDPTKWYHYWVGGVIGEAITALAWTKNAAITKLYVGNKWCVNEFDTETLQWTRIGGLEGLPYNYVTKISTDQNKVYVGTEKGICYLDLKTNEWHYFYLDRFLHGEVVLSLSVVEQSGQGGAESGPSLFALTESGASLLSFKIWTLEEKAQFYQDKVLPRHDRYGLVSDVGLKQYGDLSTYFKKSSDNDGLWTSVYLTSQIYRYATTKTSEAKESAYSAFRGIQLLNNVTGLPGFMARSVLPRGAPLPGGEWFNSTVYTDLQFKGDTSSDEIVGHITAYSLFYDLVAETSSEKKTSADLLENIVSYIISNEYRLLDYDGKETTWGMWRPLEINTIAKWMTDRGINSLEILSFILAAYRITGKQVYLDSYRFLVNENGYSRNLINQKIEVVGDIGPQQNTDGIVGSNVNHSDDELSLMSFLIIYYALQFLPNDQEFNDLRANLRLAIDKNWQHVKNEKSSMFDIIYAFSLLTDPKHGENEDFDIINMVHTLKSYPQSLIDWPYDNTERIDIMYNPELYVRNTISVDENMKRPLNYNEIGCSRWNCNPFSMKGGSGHSETDPGVWLFGYWMARYYKLIQ